MSKEAEMNPEVQNEQEKPASFEARLQAVQEMISRIERGELPLEESVRQFEQGMALLISLEAELKEMNRRLTVLREGPDGPAEEPMQGKEG